MDLMDDRDDLQLVEQIQPNSMEVDCWRPFDGLSLAERRSRLVPMHRRAIGRRNIPIFVLICLSIGIATLAEQSNSNKLLNSSNETHPNITEHLNQQTTQSSTSNHPIEVQQQQQAPSQLFLPPANKLVQPQAVGLIEGSKRKRLIGLIGGRAEEEEDGFIMQASVEQLQNESTTTTEMTPTDSLATIPDLDQRIAIDANRQQFLTHDQLLNASTKDESITLQVQSPMATQSSRAGMSKVSHVSSFLSDLFTYATQRNRPQTFGEGQQQVDIGSRITTANQPQNEQSSKSSPTSTVSSSTCPGVCRSILTASILCRNEISAPCPSFLQKCCEKDDVSFNGTPVETSAPLSPPDTDTNSSPLSDNLPKAPETAQLGNQAASAGPAFGSSPKPRDKDQFERQQSAANSRATTRLGAAQSEQTELAPTTHRTQSAHLPLDSSPGGSTSGPATSVFDAARPQPSSIYFLSSGSGEQKPAEIGSDKTSAQLAQPSHEEHKQSTRGKQQTPTSPASQSFDSPLSETSKVSSQEKRQPVLLQTINGTILHQPPISSADQAASSKSFTRPMYANWTDFHLMLQTRHPNQAANGQTVIYHSNIDPASKFGASASTQTSTSTAPITSTLATTVKQNQTDLIATTLKPSTATCSGFCMPKQHRRFCQSQSAPNNELRCDNEDEFCCTLAATSNSEQNIDSNKSNLNRRISFAATSEEPAKSSSAQGSDLEPVPELISDQHSITGSGSRSRTGQANSPTLGDEQSIGGLKGAAANSTSHQQSSGADRDPETTTSSAMGSANSNEQQSDSQQAQIGSVGNVLVELLDSWISGNTASSSNGGADDKQVNGDDDRQAAELVPTFAIPSTANEAERQPTNDRRLGLDLSFRQNSGGENQQQHRQQVAGAGSGSDPSTSNEALSASGGEATEAGKCIGYCTLPLFTMLCDSTYRSADCGASQKCCVIGRPQNNPVQQPMSSSSAAADELLDQSSVQANALEQGNNQFGGLKRQQSSAGSAVCRGSCLPIYHSSLCTRPNELQFDQSGCLPNFVCCAQQSSQQPQLQEPNQQGNNIEDSLAETLLGDSQPATSSPPADSSLLAALLPPPPPSLSTTGLAAGAISAEHQVSSNSDQPISVRHRLSHMMPQPPSSPLAGQEASSYFPLYQQQQLQPLATVRPANTKTTSQSSGIMSHLYQMFSKSTNSGKQRQPQPQQQQQQSQPTRLVAPQIGQPQQLVGINMGYLNQQPAAHYDFHQAQQLHSAANLRNPLAPIAAQQQPQVVFPAHRQHHHAAAYPTLDSSVPLMSEPLGNSKQANWNRFVVQQQQQQQQQQVAIPDPAGQQMIASSSMVTQQKSNAAQPHFSESTSGQNLVEAQQLFGFNHLSGGFNPMNAGSGNGRQTINNNNNQILQLAHPSNSVSAVHRQHSHPQVAHHQNNAHNSPGQFIHQPHQQQQPQQQQVTKQHPHSSHAIAFSAADSNSIQKQLQEQTESQLAAHRPANQQTSPVRAGSSAVQRNGIAISQDHTGAPVNGADQKLSQTNGRQNQATIRAPQKQVNSATGSLTESALTQISGPNVPGQVSSNGNLAQQQLFVQSQQPTIRPNSKQNTAANKATSTSKITEAQSLSLAPSSLNIMISNAPFIDLQRVSSAESASESQVNRVRPNYNDNQQQTRTPFPASKVTVAPAKRITNSFDRVHDDLSSNSNLDISEPTNAISCPSSCLASIVSFNCVKPNYLDENYTCPNGGICCVKQAAKINSSTPPTAVAGQRTSPLVHSATGVGANKPELGSATSSSSFSSVINEEDSSHQQTNLDTDSPAKQHDNLETSIDEQPSGSSLAEVGKGAENFQPHACGLPGPRRRLGRVMGGSDSKAGYWCWQAALMNDRNEYLCGGALIGAKWVLTAAHCVTQQLRNESQLFVRLGQHDLNSTQTSAHAKTIQVKRSYVHHNHNGETLDNDIALLRLDEAADLEESSICLICLPERSSQMEPGKRCTVTGYGYESESGPAVLRVRQTDLPVVADQTCQSQTAAALGKQFALPANSFCAGGELGQDACNGDGGSPLSCLVDGYYELAGIVSWGYQCGVKDLPGLYSKVSSFVGWINQIVSVNN